MYQNLHYLKQLEGFLIFIYKNRLYVENQYERKSRDIMAVFLKVGKSWDLDQKVRTRWLACKLIHTVRYY